MRREGKSSIGLFDQWRELSFFFCIAHLDSSPGMKNVIEKGRFEKRPFSFSSCR